MIEQATMWDRAPTRTDEDRAPKGPDRPQRGPTTWVVGLAVGAAGLVLVSGFCALGTATTTSTATGHPSVANSHSVLATTPKRCPGIYTVHAPIHLLFGQRYTISVSHIGSVVCTTGMIYNYAGLPLGMGTSHTSSVSGIPANLGTYRILVIGVGPYDNFVQPLTLQVTPA